MQSPIDYKLGSIALQTGIIYGPVSSRRLGRSLGINILSTNKKICSFDCLYCQYGFTQIKCDELKNGKNFPAVPEIEDALIEALRNIKPLPQYITFSGNGEATLHPEFTTIVERVVNIRDNLTPGIRTAILSNSSEIVLPEIREAIMQLDERIMKLDCATQDMLQRYNRPRCRISLKDIISALQVMEGITIQTLFTQGKRGNYFPAHIQAWFDTIAQIKPKIVQIYSLDRSAPSADLLPVPLNELRNLSEKLEKHDIRSAAY